MRINNEVKLDINTLIDELLIEIKSNLMAPKEPKPSDMPKAKSVNFGK